MHQLKSLVVVLFFTAAGSAASSRPRYIFINKTANHAHDLALKCSLKIAEGRSGIENALILLDRLPDNKSIEETAVMLFDRWKIGNDRKGKGVLYLYSEKENRFKIEVSYALEPMFPDALCGRLADGARTYMLSEIPQDFLSELIITMNLHGADLKTDHGNASSAVPWFPTALLSGGAGVQKKGYRPTFEDYRKAIQTVDVGRRADYDPSGDPNTTVERYLKSLDEGIGDPKLPLLTEGSQFFRMIVPRNAGQQRRVLAYFRKSLPYTITEVNGMAVAVFQPGTANLPIVLRKSTAGQWLVDEPKAWTYFHRFEDGVDFLPKYDDLPLIAGLARVNFPTTYKPIYRRRVKTPAPPAIPYSLETAIHQLEDQLMEEPTNAGLYAKLGEIYLFEINWISRAIDSFRKAAALEPKRPGHHWRLYDLYLNNSEPEKALDELRAIVNLVPYDAEARTWLDFYSDFYTLKPGEFFE